MQTETSIALYNASKAAMNTSLVPIGDDIDVGCAISVNVLAQRVLGHQIGGDVSTSGLLTALIKSSSFVEVNCAQPGDIIISASGTSTIPNTPISHGHTGVVMKFPQGDNGICSNNSYNGLWQETYTLSQWHQRYGVQGGYPVRLFRAK